MKHLGRVMKNSDIRKLIERKSTNFPYLTKHIFGLEFIIFCWDLKENVVIPASPAAGRRSRSWNRVPGKNLSPRRRTTDGQKHTPPIHGRSIFILVLFFSIRTHVRFFRVSKSFFSTKFYAFSMVRSYFALSAIESCALVEMPYFQNQNET